jgi:Type II secretion system (T2SS), protein G
MKTPVRTVMNCVIAISLAATVFVIVIVTAGIQLRGDARLCPRQWETSEGLRRLVRQLEPQIAQYVQDHKRLPDRLADLPDFGADVSCSWLERNANGDVLDRWNNPAQYQVAGDAFVVVSFGRDGSAGGAGPDADLYSDGRDRDARKPTFVQFLTESDVREITTRGFFLDGILAAGIVACTVYMMLRTKSKPPETMTVRKTAMQITIVVIAAVVLGIFLLPAHVPNGH